jgi:hypothetical protein
MTTEEVVVTDTAGGADGDKGAADTTTKTTIAEGGPEGGDGDKGGDKTTLAAGGETDKGDGDGKKAEGDKPAEGEAGTKKDGDKKEGEEKKPDDKKGEDKKPEPTDAERLKAMREEIAKHRSAGDEKLYKKELARLERIADLSPKAIWGMYRELEAKMSEGNLVKIPGKDAKPEEIAAFQKAMGWTEKPEDMIGQIKLDNGMVIGEADKPMLTGFLAAVHGATSATDFASKATAWYYNSQEEAAAALDEADDTFRRESERALKDELGPAFKRRINSISTLFSTAPGGADAKNPQSTMARLLGGRTADGKIIGNDPEISKLLMAWSAEINPVASVVEDNAGSSRSIVTELTEIKALRQTNPSKYWSPAVQARELELITAQQKDRARSA